jgi:hypothetical protein
MALPSQNERTNELGRAYVYRRQQQGGRPPMPLIVAGLALAAVGAAWGIYSLIPSGSATQPTSGEPLIRVDQKPVEAAIAAPVSAPAPSPKAPDPVIFRQDTKVPAAQPTTNQPTTSQPSTAQPAPKTDAPASPSATAPASPTGTPAATPAAATGSPQPETSRPKLDDPSKLVVSDPSKKNAPATNPAAPATQPASTPTAAIPASGSTADVAALIAQGEAKLSSDPVQARAILSRAYAKAAPGDQERLRDELNKINNDLLFSPRVVPGDPLTEQYSVASGDSIVKITKARGLAVDWRFIQRINKADPARLRIGQKLKLVRGPFHAVVHKGEYRLDVFQGPPDDPANWLFIRSFKVGLGEGNSTPPGTFVVRRSSKLVNPPWVNPRTGEKFGADDPKNPIGEHWLGLEGVGESTPLTGYGIHGTIDPDSIGKQRSMGCVRLDKEEIAMVYEMLEEQISVVKILP